MAWPDVILPARLILFFTDHAAVEPLADARGTLGLRGTPVENHWLTCYTYSTIFH